jgi:hypothetical protein
MAEFDIRGEKPSAFGAAVAEAKKGDVIIYHEGENMLACPHRSEAEKASGRGKVALVAKRLGPRHFLFMAQRMSAR